MKNNIDFYQHYANSDQHPKFKMLRVVMGWSGEGKFWALNNKIALSENCCLDISKKYNKAAIASDLDFTLDGFDEFIKFLLEECELIRECSDGVITTDIIQENFQRVSINREKARERKQRALEKVSKGSGELSKSSGDQSKKVKESKVKGKEKENSINANLKIILEEKIDSSGMSEFKDNILEFFEYRQSKPKKNRYQSEKGVNGLFRSLNGCKEAGLDIQECLEITMEENWQSPTPEYVAKKIRGKQNGDDRWNF